MKRDNVVKLLSKSFSAAAIQRSDAILLAQTGPSDVLVAVPESAPTAPNRAIHQSNMSRRTGGLSDFSPLEANQSQSAASPPPSPRGPTDTIGTAAAAALSTNITTPNEERRKARSNIPSLVCAILASMTTGGTTYAFGLYSADLKSALKLKPSELDTISTAFFFAGLASWLPGLIVDRFGTRRGMVLGGSMGATSLVSYWLVSKKLVFRHWLFRLQDTQTHSPMLVPILSILGILIFLSCALVTASVFKIIVSTSGPGTKGSAVGVAKGYVGLGAGAYACLLEALRYPKQSHLDFLPMAGLCFVMCAVIPSLVLLPTQQQMERDLMIQDEATPLHFRVIYASLGAMATIIVTSSMLALSDGRESHQNFAVAALIVTVWIGPILSLLWLPRAKRQQSAHDNTIVPMTDGIERISMSSPKRPLASNEPMLGTTAPHNEVSSPSVNDFETEDSQEEEEFLLMHAGTIGQHPSAAAEQEQDSVVPAERVELNMVQMLQTPSAMLMLWTCTILVGAGTVETNNMGQMVEAMGFSDSVTPASLALFSVAQAASRVATGSLSEAALSWNTKRFCVNKGIPRPFFFVAASLLAFAGHGILSVASHEFGFVVGVTLSGAAFGMCWPLMVLVSGEVFGTANAAANYMFYDGFTSAIGTLLLTKGLSQHVCTLPTVGCSTKRHSRRSLIAPSLPHTDEDHISPNSLDPDTCVGKECFELTHVLVAILSLTCVVTSGLMVHTSRHAYNRPALSSH